MKRLFIIILILCACGLYAGDLHVTPYSRDAINYAQTNNIKTILWFVDDSDVTFKMKDEILRNGQLIAATENVMWLIVDTSLPENRSVAKTYDIKTIPTIISLNSEGHEIYGSRISYDIVGQRASVPDALFVTLVANDIIDWQIADDWYDNRYNNNLISLVDYNYWSNKHEYDYNSSFYDVANRTSVVSSNTVNYYSTVVFLYDLYPSLNPIIYYDSYDDYYYHVYSRPHYKPRYFINTSHNNGYNNNNIIYFGHNNDRPKPSHVIYDNGNTGYNQRPSQFDWQNKRPKEFDWQNKRDVNQNNSINTRPNPNNGKPSQVVKPNRPNNSGNNPNNNSTIKRGNDNPVPRDNPGNNPNIKHGNDNPGPRDNPNPSQNDRPVIKREDSNRDVVRPSENREEKKVENKDKKEERNGKTMNRGK